MKNNLKLKIFIFMLGITLMSPSYAIHYTYDALNRLVSVSYSSSKKINYSYDAGGNLIRVHISANMNSNANPVDITNEISEVETLATSLCNIPYKEFPNKPEPCACFHAVVNPQTMIAHIPAVDTQTIDDIVGETGLIAILKASIKLLPGTSDWKAVSAELFGLSASNEYDICHAKFTYVQNSSALSQGPSIELPYVDVPVYTVLPDGQKLITSVNVYKVILRALAKDESNLIFHVESYDYLYTKTLTN